jgi:hypothetical protein
MSVRKFVGRSLRNFVCEPLLRAVASLLYVSTKDFSSEGSINIDIRLMVRRWCAEPENRRRAAVRLHKDTHTDRHGLDWIHLAQDADK